MEQLGDLIGLVVDLANKKTLVRTSYFIPKVVSDTFEPNDEGNVAVTDIFGNNRVIESGYKAIPKFEGKTIRIFKHDGTVYFSSTRKISVERSKVAGNQTLMEIYQSLNGPTPNELFDSSKLSSPFVHLFDDILCECSTFR